MTEKQIERIRTKIARVKSALAAYKKRWGGYYNDSGGIGKRFGKKRGIVGKIEIVE